jgi:hypothetical protein
MLNTLATLSFLSFFNVSPSQLQTQQEVSYIAVHESDDTILTELEDLKEEKENSIFLIKSEKDILLKVPFVHQKDDLKDTPDEWAGGSACGPSAITMALQFHGQDVSLYEVVNKLPPEVYVKGVMFYNLAKGPEFYGYQSESIDINTEQIYTTLLTGNPILLNIQNYDGITGHEVVVVGISEYDSETKTAKSLIVHDPFREAYREFEFVNETTLLQPEGWHLPIGNTKPFYITKSLYAQNPAV